MCVADESAMCVADESDESFMRGASQVPRPGRVSARRLGPGRLRRLGKMFIPAVSFTLGAVYPNRLIKCAWPMSLHSLGSTAVIGVFRKLSQVVERLIELGHEGAWDPAAAVEVVQEQEVFTVL
jgi:hypothetical protein